jgi:beta-carotene hydroxylase
MRILSLKHSLIRYKIDLISVTLVIGVLVLSFLPIYLKLNLWSLWLLTGLLLFFKPITSLVQHNHVHYSIFNSRLLNKFFDLLLAVSAGHLCSEWTLHHNIGHHGNRINSPADTSSVRHARTREYMSKLQYIVSGSFKIYPDCCRMAWRFYKQGKPRFLMTLIYETVFCIAFYAYFLNLNFKMALLFLVLANLINRALVWLGAYWQHLNVPAQNTYDSSNMYTAYLFNLISLNIGYHVAHHEQPSLHWSRLKERTQSLLHRIPDSQILQKLP